MSCPGASWLLGASEQNKSTSLWPQHWFSGGDLWVRNYTVQFSLSIMSDSLWALDCSMPGHTKYLSNYSGVRCFQRKVAPIITYSYWCGVLKKITEWLVHPVALFTPSPYTHPGDKVSMLLLGSGIFAKKKLQIMGLDEMAVEVSVRKEPGNKG